MATRSRIGIRNGDGTITSIYCHWDGYPESNGKILKDHYDDEYLIDHLIGLGNLSMLENTIEDCEAYGRDRGEKNTSAIDHLSLEEFFEDGEDYNYLFEDGRWRCWGPSKKEIDLY